MFQNDCNEVIRNEHINITDFCKENMQYVDHVGYFKTIQSNIVRYNKPEEETYLIFYLLRGNSILVSGEDYIAIETNSTLILACDSIFSIYLDCCEVYFAFLHGSKIESYIKYKNEILDFQFRKKSEIFFHSIFSSLNKYQMIDEFSISSAVLRLYSDIFIYKEGFKLHSDKQEIIQKSVSFIEDNYMNHISVLDISRAIGYSEYYFLRMFKEVMKMSPYEYLIRKRLSQVKILLLSTTMTIEEIAFDCGFKSDISLYKAFKSTYSITPREYKKSVGK